MLADRVLEELVKVLRLTAFQVLLALSHLCQECSDN
jgi:hypothetical protein